MLSPFEMPLEALAKKKDFSTQGLIIRIILLLI